MIRRVLVIGSSRGIGRAAADKLTETGYVVTLHGRTDTKELLDAHEQLGSHNPETRYVSFDVTDASQAEQVLSRELAEHGGYFGVVFAAGVTRDKPFAGMSVEDWNAPIATSLGGFFHVVRPLILPMIRLRQGGRIVVISSLSGVIGNRGQVNYSAAKAGLHGAVKSLALELASRSITVNAVAPGAVDTDMVDAEVRKRLLQYIPMQRLATVREVASAVHYLVSDDAGYVTGQVLTMGGGLG